MYQSLVSKMQINASFADKCLLPSAVEVADPLEDCEHRCARLLDKQSPGLDTMDMFCRAS